MCRRGDKNDGRQRPSNDLHDFGNRRADNGLCQAMPPQKGRAMDKPAEPRASSRSNVRVDNGGAAFIIGVWGWLFTIGYLHLTFWQGVLAIILWPVYLGWHFSPFNGG
jgi:hypothetical protein